MLRGRRLWALVGVVVLANIIIRWLWVSAFQTRPVSDFAVYFGAATRWADGGGFTLDGEHATVAWPPGWPLTLRLLFEVTGASVDAAYLLQVVLSAMGAGLVVLVAYASFGVARSGSGPDPTAPTATADPLALPIAGVAGAVYTLQPATWARDSVLGTEPLFTVFLLAGLLALLTLPGRRGAVLTGLLWGCGSLVRGTLLYAFPLIGLVALARRLGWRAALTHTALAAAAIGLVLTPWTIRNYRMTGEIVPISSNLGQNLWQGTQADVGYWWSDDPRENPVLRADSETENNQIGKAAAWDYWRTHPVEWLVRAPVKITGLYADNGEAFHWLYRTSVMTKEVKDRWKAVADLVYWLVMSFAVVGMVLVWRRCRAVAIALIGPIAYTTAVFTFFLTWDRFRAPLMPVFTIFAAYTAVQVLRKDRSAFVDRSIDQ